MDMPIASRKRRIFAFIIDLFLFGYLTSLATYFIFATLKTPLDTPLLHNTSIQFGIWICSVVIFAIKDSYRGLGPGKLLMGIRAFKTNREPANFIRHFIRNISLFAWPVEAIIMILNSNKRRLGDYMGDTQVFRDEHIQTSHRGYAGIFLICLYIFSPSLPKMDLSTEGFQEISQYMLQQSDAFQFARQQVLNQPSIPKLIGPIEKINIANNSQIHLHNDQGVAKFVLKVIGETGELPVYIELDRNNSQWELVSLTYEQVEELGL